MSVSVRRKVTRQSTTSRSPTMGLPCTFLSAWPIGFHPQTREWSHQLAIACMYALVFASQSAIQWSLIHWLWLMLSHCPMNLTLELLRFCQYFSFRLQTKTSDYRLQVLLTMDSTVYCFVFCCCHCHFHCYIVITNQSEVVHPGESREQSRRRAWEQAELFDLHFCICTVLYCIKIWIIFIKLSNK